MALIRPRLVPVVVVACVLLAAAPAPASGSSFLGAFEELFAPAALFTDLARILTEPAGGDLAILGVGFGLSMISMRAGGDILTLNDSEPRLGRLGAGMTFIGRRTALYPALVGLFAAGKALDDPGLTGSAAELTQAVLLTDLIVAPMKHAFGRMRPDGNDASSYPSGHAAAAFAIATVLQRRLGVGAGGPAYCLAAVMGAARVDQRRHFLSDVVAGAAIGIVAARTVGRRFEDRRRSPLPAA